MAFGGEMSEDRFENVKYMDDCQSNIQSSIFFLMNMLVITKVKDI